MEPAFLGGDVRTHVGEKRTTFPFFLLWFCWQILFSITALGHFSLQFKRCMWLTWLMWLTMRLSTCSLVWCEDREEPLLLKLRQVQLPAVTQFYFFCTFLRDRITQWYLAWSHPFKKRGPGVCTMENSRSLESDLQRYHRTGAGAYWVCGFKDSDMYLFISCSFALWGIQTELKG